MRAAVSPLRRWLVPLAGGALTLLIAAGVLARFYREPDFLPPDDFLQYWASGRLALDGGNPYDAEQLLRLQRDAGRTDPNAVLMWNPPWTLSLCLPFGALPARTAQLAWLVLQLGLMVWAADRLWRLYGGPVESRWVAWGLVALAPMTMFLFVAGQSSGWLVVGLVGFLLAVRGAAPWAALAALCAIKPHLFVPLWVAWALAATRSRADLGRLAWGVLAGVLATAVAMLADGDVWRQYLDALRHPGSATHRPLSDWNPPLLGYHLRMALAPEWFALQFLPTAVAAVGTAVYWWSRRDAWDWLTELPRLVVVGALAAPYGAWHYDLLILLVPIVATAARVAHGGRLAMTVAALAFGLFVIAAWVPSRGEWYVWMTPAVALGCGVVCCLSPLSRLGRGAGGEGTTLPQHPGTSLPRTALCPHP